MRSLKSVIQIFKGLFCDKLQGHTHDECAVVKTHLEMMYLHIKALNNYIFCLIMMIDSL